MTKRIAVQHACKEQGGQEIAARDDDLVRQRQEPGPDGDACRAHGESDASRVPAAHHGPSTGSVVRLPVAVGVLITCDSSGMGVRLTEPLRERAMLGQLPSPSTTAARPAVDDEVRLRPEPRDRERSNRFRVQACTCEEGSAAKHLWPTLAVVSIDRILHPCPRPARVLSHRSPVIDPTATVAPRPWRQGNVATRRGSPWQPCAHGGPGARIGTNLQRRCPLRQRSQRPGSDRAHPPA